MRERVREVVGIWMPMILGLLLIAVAVNFLLATRPPVPDPNFPLDPVAAATCGGALAIVGALLALSTYGRWKKVRAGRR